MEQENNECNVSASGPDFFAFASGGCSNSGENTFPTSTSGQSEVEAKTEQNIEQENNECDVSASGSFPFASCTNNGFNTFATSTRDHSEVQAKAEQNIEQANNGCDTICDWI